jgi:hypothetical protein
MAARDVGSALLPDTRRGLADFMSTKSKVERWFDMPSGQEKAVASQPWRFELDLPGCFGTRQAEFIQRDKLLATVPGHQSEVFRLSPWTMAIEQFLNPHTPGCCRIRPLTQHTSLLLSGLRINRFQSNFDGLLDADRDSQQPLPSRSAETTTSG